LESKPTETGNPNKISAGAGFGKKLDFRWILSRIRIQPYLQPCPYMLAVQVLVKVLISCRWLVRNIIIDRPICNVLLLRLKLPFVDKFFLRTANGAALVN